MDKRAWGQAQNGRLQVETNTRSYCINTPHGGCPPTPPPNGGQTAAACDNFRAQSPRLGMACGLREAAGAWVHRGLRCAFALTGKSKAMVGNVQSAIKHVLRRVRYSYLFLPALIAVGFGVLAFALVRVDRAFGGVGSFPGGAGAARVVLSTIAGALATTVGVAFSVTIVTLQLVSQQFSPRTMRQASSATV